jgi:iron complex transport system ATP-binding protein
MSLQIKDLSFSYEQKHKVFEKVNFLVNKGEVLCILGPNGCGKSTFPKIRQLLLKYDKGSVLLNGKTQI